MTKMLNLAAAVAFLFAALGANAQSSDKQGLADYLLEYHLEALASGLPAEVDGFRNLTDIHFDEDQVVFEFELFADDIYERFLSGEALAEEILCFGSETRWLPLLLAESGWGARVVFENPPMKPLQFSFSPEDIREKLLPDGMTDSWRVALYNVHLEAYGIETISVGEDYLYCFDTMYAGSAADVEAYFIGELGVENYLEYRQYLEHLAAYLGKKGVTISLINPEGGRIDGPTFTMVPDGTDGNGFTPPTFRGNDPATFSEWVAKRMKYPKSALSEGIRGTVYVSFVVDKDGRLADVKVIQGVEQRLDDEAVRIVGKSPRWRPARKEGEPVRVSYTIPVSFSW